MILVCGHVMPPENPPTASNINKNNNNNSNNSANNDDSTQLSREQQQNLLPKQRYHTATGATPTAPSAHAKFCRAKQNDVICILTHTHLYTDMFGHLLYETDIQYYMHSMHSHTHTHTHRLLS